MSADRDVFPDDDPATREEFPTCWLDEARGLSGAFHFGEKVKPWNWLELDAEKAEKLWSLLVGFVGYFNRRYGEHSEKRIPPCWAEHGPIVEELTTLVFSRWHAFESAHGSVGGAQYWHSYTLPSFYERLHDWLGDDLLACQQGRHRDRDDPSLNSANAWSVRTEIVRMHDVARRREAAASIADRPTGEVSVIEVPFLDAVDESGPVRPRSRRSE